MTSMNLKYWTTIFLYLIYSSDGYENPTVNEKRKEQGPYRMYLKKFTTFESALPLEPNKTLDYYINLYEEHGARLIAGNITILGDTTTLKGRLTSYTYKADKLRKDFQLSNLNCHYSAGMYVLKIAQVPFNKKTCAMKKGTYRFNGINMDALFHNFLQEWEYGTTVIQIEITRKAYSVICMEIIVRVEARGRG